MKSVGLRSAPIVLLLFATGVVCSALPAQTMPVARTNESSTAVGTAANEPKHAGAYGKLPLSFEANHGQTDRQVKFLSRGSGYALFLTDDEAILAVNRSNSDRKQSATVPPTRGKPTSSEITEFLRMSLIGANSAVRVSGIDELAGKSNYFIGSNPEKWQRNISTYAKVKYEDVYPGVNLIYYGSQRRLEYDFVVSAGADSKVIRLRFRGASGVRINEQGALVVKTQTDVVKFEQPAAYQETDGKRRTIEARYVLEPGSTVGFKVGAYDQTKPLVIDPVLVYSTFLGGSGDDYGQGIAVDSAGNTYVTGFTNSTNFPTVNAFQSSLEARNHNVFVAKINASGSALVYSTYLGGSGNDAGQSIAADSSGNAYVTGVTGSFNFPTANALQSSLGGNTNAFVTKINASGSGLDYSTYLGGNMADTGYGVAVDSTGNAYVTGSTDSTNFPTVNALQSACGACGTNGYTNAFVAKINVSGSALLYSTYLGGSGGLSYGDYGYGIAVDSAGDAFVAGWASSGNFPTVNAFQPTCSALANCGFVTKFNPSGSALMYSTYLGGNEGGSVNVSAGGYATSIAVDSGGNAYVTGETNASNFPILNAFQPSCGGCNGAGVTDAFVTKINASGSALVYSTFLGGSGDDYGQGIAVDSAGDAYVTGNTTSSDFPMVNALQSSCGSGCAIPFVAMINASGSALVYSTYFGVDESSVAQEALGIAVDPAGNAYVTGYTNSSNFPTVNALQSTFGGGTCNGGSGSSRPCIDAFAARISAANLSPSSLTFANQAVGTTATPQTVTLGNNGTTTLTISNLAVGGTNALDFAETDSCGGSVAAGASCTLDITFTPTATGTRTGTLTITDSATSPSLLTVALTGTGVPPAPIVSLSSTNVVFGSQSLDTTSAAQTLTLQNTGTATLNIQTVTLGGANVGEFALASGTTCTSGASVAENGTCVFQLTFTPTALGPGSATVSIIDNAAGSPQTVSLSGISGPTPLISVTPSNISFASQYVGASSLPHSVTVTNTGNAALTITSVTSSPSDFGLLSACGNSLAAGSTCSIGVFFDPTVGGTRTGTLTISDNASSSPQTVSLTGAGQDFSMTPTSSASASVAPGQTASYALTISPNGGFSQSVTLTCSGGPSQSTCTVSPSSIALNGSAAATVAVTVTTTAASLFVRESPRGGPLARVTHLPALLILALLGFSLSSSLIARLQKWRFCAAYGLLLLLFICAGAAMSGCGGGGGSSNRGNAATPAGTYTLAVSGTFTSGSAAVTRNANLTLVVQ